MVKINKKSYKYGEKHHNWKGDKAGYHAIHKWLNENYPRNGICEDCGNICRTSWTFNKPHNYHNSKDYTRNINDYTERCDKCHKDRKKRSFFFTKKELIELYWISEYNMNNRILDVRQKTTKKISEIKKCAKPTILRNMKRFNIISRTQQESKKLQYMKKNELLFFTIDDLIELYWVSKENMNNRIINKKQKSAIEIGKIKKCSETTIRNAMKNFNILRRTQSEAKILRDKKNNN